MIFVALETGKILTPSPLAIRRTQHGNLNRVRRQLRLSESEKWNELFSFGLNHRTKTPHHCIYNTHKSLQLNLIFQSF